MFGILSDLAKAAVGVVTLPVAVVTDVAETVGLKQDSYVNHTGKALDNVVSNLQNAVDPNK